MVLCLAEKVALARNPHEELVTLLELSNIHFVILPHRAYSD
jgi:hypothetical protein